ncbi:MAG: Phospholipid/glycerol acyltransferase, partial [Pedosphaera sp.]|nr:Phospholipid/glycerol acyltransferase [Pedosphaera sp.]
ERKKECINELNAAIEQNIQSLILHIPRLEQVRVVEAVKRLYLDRLRVADRLVSEPLLPRAEELLLTQRIARAVETVYRAEPERAAVFVRRLGLYEKWQAIFHIDDALLADEPRKRKLARLGLLWAAMAILGAPIAVYGWAHRLAPFCVVAWAVHHFANVDRHKAQTSTAAIIAGLVSFGFFYGLYAWIFHFFFGWHAAVWYGLTLPVAGMIAHYYLRELRRLWAGLRGTFVLLRAPAAARRLLALRGKLIAEIEDVAGTLRTAQTKNAQPANHTPPL